MIDIRAGAVKYYDLHKPPFNDVPFYINRICSADANILELGCGTGRTLLPLVSYCNYIHGLDISEAMLNICRDKLIKQKVPPTKAFVEMADITDFKLDRKFDFIIAPYRVFQNIETDKQVNGFFQCIRSHLTPDGRCILNVFRTFNEPDKLAQIWSDPQEHFVWEKAEGKVKITCYERRNKFRLKPLTIYPELIYRKFMDGTLIEEKVLKIAMRCYYPEEFEQIITNHGFEITGRWGGYDGEAYYKGNELIIEFSKGNKK